MAYYYLNKQQQSNGDYEVHDATCFKLPAAQNREELGWHASCVPAVAEAKRRHPTWHRINGCYHCSRPCHTT